MKKHLVVLLLSLSTVTPTVFAKAPNQPAAPLPATALDLRIEQLPAVLAGKLNYEEFFAPSFLAAVPPAQIKALSDQFAAQHGQPLKISGIDHKGTTGATIKIEYDKAIATADISIEPTAPNKVVGLLIKGFDRKGDTAAKIDADFAALPGKAGYLVEKIGVDGKRQQIAGRATGQQFAIGSTFKLYVLAELASQVQAGRRSWSDVVPILENNYSSSATQNWPRSTPVTLQTLATWMISVSDNASTDALIRVLGREAIEEKLAAIGHSDPDRMLPLLTTVEAFAIKSNATLLAQFQKASEAQQRAMLATQANAFKFENINMLAFGSGPVAIDSVEWFASPADIAALMHNIRRIGNQTAWDIMTVNKGVAPVTAAKWHYLGYKGGYEPGVISMSFLAQSKAGEWYAISGSWNNPLKEVDNEAFATLMTRLLDRVAN